MLNQVLIELEKADGKISLSALSKKLEIDYTALEGMISFWVRKGKLKLGRGNLLPTGNNMCGGCNTCAGPEACPVSIQLPRLYSIDFKE